MDRLDELTLKLIDGTASQEELLEWRRLADGAPGALERVCALMEQEGLLRTPAGPTGTSDSVMRRLRKETRSMIPAQTMDAIRSMPRRSRDKRRAERVRRTRSRTKRSRVPGHRAGHGATKESKGWWLHTAAAALLIAAVGLAVWQPWKGAVVAPRVGDPDAQKVAVKPSTEQEEQLIQGLMGEDAAAREAAMKRLSENPEQHWELIKRLAQHDRAEVRASARAVVVARLDVLGTRLAELETAQEGALKAFAQDVQEDLWEGRLERQGAENTKVLVALGGVGTSRLREGERFTVSGSRPAILRLADGSRVRLKAGSEGMARGGTEDARQVFELIRGEARFKVEKGAGGFRVETPSGKVTVLGTEFNVELRPGTQKGEKAMTGKMTLALIVTVMVGSVQVEWNGGAVKLSAGQQQVFAAEGEEAAEGQGEAKAEAGAQSFTGRVVTTTKMKETGPVVTGVKFLMESREDALHVVLDRNGMELGKRFNGQTVTVKGEIVKREDGSAGLVVTGLPKVEGK